MPKYKIQLAAYNISDELYSKIRDYVPAKFFKVVSNAEMREYQYGAPLKRCVYYNGANTLIVPDWVLDHILGKGQKEFPYKRLTHQVILYVKHGATKNIEHTLTGMRANRAMRRLLKQAGYTTEEINQRLHMFEAEYNASQKQIHYLKLDSRFHNKIYRYQDCAEFDINSAYCSILIEIFPEAKELLIKAYKERKIHPENKAMFNYFVGMLCDLGHRKTYNYIVQHTTAKLNDFINSHGGWKYVLYANTDGVIMKTLPQYTYEVSKELGAFKLESVGDCYIYQCDNYWALQIGDKMVGSILWEARKHCDLSKNVVVKYDRVSCSKQSDIDNTKNAMWFKAENIRQWFPGIIIEGDTENEKNNKNLCDKVRKDSHKNLPLLQEIRL